MPLVSCDPNKTADTYTGHDVEMFRLLAEKLGLAEGEDFYFNCTQFSNFKPDLTTDGGVCDAAMCGISVTNERKALGFKYVYPYYSTGLGILTKSGINYSSGWAWVKPFDLSLWVGLILTMLLVPVITFLLEFWTLKRRIHLSDVAPGVGEASWRSTWALFGQETFEVSSLSARLFIFAFTALSLIVSSTYTANLAAFLTVNSVNGQIRSVSDLRGRSAHAADIYRQELRTKYGIFTTALSTEGDEGMRELANVISSGELAAGIEDQPTMQYVASNKAALCDLRVLPEIIIPFDYAIAFRFDADDKVVDAFSSATLKLKEEDLLSNLKTSYITGGEKACQSDGDVNSGTAQISFKDLYGLWVILGAFMLLGFLVMLATRFYHYRKHVRYLDDPKMAQNVVPRKASDDLASAGAMPPPHDAHHDYMTLVDNQVKLSVLQESDSCFKDTSRKWEAGADKLRSTSNISKLSNMSKDSNGEGSV